MSDDFLNDISDAMDNGGNVPDTTVVIDTPQQTQQPQQNNPVDPGSREAVEKNILDQFDEADQPTDIFGKQVQDGKQKTEKTENKTEKNTEQNQEKSTDDKTNTNTKGQETTKTSDKTDGKGDSYLDVFLGTNDKNDLVFADGSVAFPAGRSRQHFEKVKAAGREARKQAETIAKNAITLAENFQKLRNEHETLKKSGLGNIAQNVGATEAELQQAIGYMTQYKQNPIAALKQMLTEAQMNGINLKELGVEGGMEAATVTNVVKTQLQDMLGPLLQKSENDQANDAEVAEARTFLTNFPDALKYVDVIEKAKLDHPDLSYEGIWLRLLPHLPKDEGNSDDTKNKQDDQNKGDTTVVTNTQQPKPQPQPRNQPDQVTMSYQQIAQQIAKEAQNP